MLIQHFIHRRNGFEDSLGVSFLRNKGYIYVKDLHLDLLCRMMYLIVKVNIGVHLMNE